MSLAGTLGKIALGAIAARGVGRMMGGNGGGGSDMLGSLLGSVLGGGQQGGSNPLSGLLGGGGGQQSNALSGLLGSVLGGGQQSGGGLGAVLGALAGGGQQSGGLGGLLDSLGGAQGQQGSGLGGILNQVLAGQQNASVQATPSQEEEAAIMLRAMISACKADGQIDAEEQTKLTEHLGDDVTEEEANLVRQELTSPLDIDGLINDIPSGMEQQAYLMSLLAIKLDSQEEALYLDKLAKGLNISPEQSNAIHAQLGVPALYG